MKVVFGHVQDFIPRIRRIRRIRRMTELCQAIVQRDAARLRHLLARGADPNRLGRPYTPLICLVREYIYSDLDPLFEEMLSLLVQYRVDVDRPVCFTSPLMHAANAGNQPLMHALVDAGADVLATVYRMAALHASPPLERLPIAATVSQLVDELVGFPIPVVEITILLLQFSCLLGEAALEQIPFLYSRDIPAHFERQPFLFQLAVSDDARDALWQTVTAIDRVNPAIEKFTQERWFMC